MCNSVDVQFCFFFYLSDIMEWGGGWVVKATRLQFYPLEMDQVSILQGDGWAPGQVWKKSAPQGFSPGPSSPWLVAITTELSQLTWLL